MSGDDVLALKRALSRAGYLPWQGDEFTNTYGTDTDRACQQSQLAVGIKGSGGGKPQGHYGDSTHEALRSAQRAGKNESAWDDYSAQLYREAIVPNEPPSFAFKRD